MSRRIALISEHASPLGALGGVDGGGQNVYVGQVARHLAAHGWGVDVLTRRDAETLPDVVEWGARGPRDPRPGRTAARCPEGGAAPVHGRLHRVCARVCSGAPVRSAPRQLLDV